MAYNNSQHDIILLRREQVAKLRLQKLTVRQIAAQLNVSVGCAAGDLKAIEKDWRDSAIADIGEHKARQLAEIELVKQAAWELAEPDLDVVLKALSQEAKLLGTDAPIKTEDVSTLTQEARDARIAELLAKRGG